MLKFLCLSILIFISTSKPLFQNLSIVLNMTTKEEFLELKTKSDLLSCVYFYASKYCERCEQLEAPMYKFANNLGIGAVKIYHADCYKLWRNKDLHEEFDAYCNPKKKEELPKILFLEPPFRRYNPYTNKIMNAYDRMFDGQASARFNIFLFNNFYFFLFKLFF